MFRITYTPQYYHILINKIWQIQGILDAARENGGLIEEWDSRSGIWREI